MVRNSFSLMYLRISLSLLNQLLQSFQSSLALSVIILSISLLLCLSFRTCGNGVRNDWPWPTKWYFLLKIVVAIWSLASEFWAKRKVKYFMSWHESILWLSWSVEQRDLTLVTAIARTTGCRVDGADRLNWTVDYGICWRTGISRSYLRTATCYTLYIYVYRQRMEFPGRIRLWRPSLQKE